jgi:hypothetical protein
MPTCPNAPAREIEHQTRLTRIREFIELANHKNDPEAHRKAQWVLHRMNGIALFGVYPYQYKEAETVWNFAIEFLSGRRDRNALERINDLHPIDAAIDIAYDLHTNAPLKHFMQHERDVPEAFLVDLFINITRIRDLEREKIITLEEQE